MVSSTRATRATALLVLAPSLLLAGCGGGSSNRAATTSPTTSGPTTTSPASPTTTPAPGATAPAGTSYAPVIVPADFSTTIDNPFLPLVPGTRRTYKGTTAEGTEDIVMDVLTSTRTVMGVTCVIVRDTVRLDGKVIEDTYDWYAQHRDGSVWYFGEDTKELEDGKVVSTKGAWEAGVKNAKPGVVMPAEPQVGDRFRQEYAVGEAEDEFAVLATDATATLATGALTGLVKTEDTTRLDSGLVEHKYYARGTGFVLVEHVKGPQERIELVSTGRF